MGGDPPARRPRRELRSARRLEARPGPAAAHRRRSLARASKPARALRSLRHPPHRRCLSLIGGSARCLEAPLQLLIINFARNSFMAHSNIEFASLELQRFWGVSKNDRDKLRAKCGWRWCRRCPRVSHLGPVDQTARLSETAVACARECLRGLETAIAFAGENWVLLARFSVALVLSVSMGVVQGRALVMVVSRRTVSVVVEGSLVSPSPPHCVLCAKKFALRGHDGPKLVFSGVPGELFRACRPATATGLGPPLPAGPAAGPCGASGTLHIGNGGAFARHEAFQQRVVGVSEPHVVQFPRLVVVS